jgi:hypothetical protein
MPYRAAVSGEPEHAGAESATVSTPLSRRQIRRSRQDFVAGRQVPGCRPGGSKQPVAEPPTAAACRCRGAHGKPSRTTDGHPAESPPIR